MSAEAAWPSALCAFLEARLDAGEDGKTFLIGFHGDTVRFALAAGLRHDADQARFLVFARYLLHHRFCCDGHALLMPAEVEGRAVYAAEHQGPGTTGAGLIDPGVGWRQVALSPGLIGDLAEREAALPGLVRREFDRLYEALRIPSSGLPDRLAGT